MTDCELCAFNNPKGTVTGIVIREGKVLLLKRTEEPYQGMWDFPGGYMHAGETPEEATRREIKEELHSECALDFIDWFPGTASWNGRPFPVISHAYLVELQGPISLNEENAAHAWFPLDDIKEVAFDSNMSILAFMKKKFAVDFPTVKNLVRELDESAEIQEQNFYRAALHGYVSKKIVNGTLVGMGWIFPRRTLLRTQAVVEDMIVDSRERGKRYGEDILKDLIRWAKENRIEVVELTTNPARVAANRLYQKHGFMLHPTNHYLLKL